MTEKVPDEVAFTDREMDLIRRVAKRDRISEDEAATNLAKASLARRTRKRTGRAARVFSMRGKR